MLPALYRCAIGALIYLANLCYICNLWPNLEMHFMFIQYGTYNICPGPVFQCEFDGGIRFVTRLTIFGNFSKYALYIYMFLAPFFDLISTMMVIM